jgi:DNA polymerase-3 subunit alpha
VIVYQEQVMQIAQVLAGYSLGEADLLRRAMGKKIKEEMDKQRVRFVEGAVERDVSKPQADMIFDLLAKFANYGFNKSHAAAYGIVSYQTAYLKAHYPVEFLAASMTLDMSNTDKLVDFRQDARRLGHRGGAAFGADQLPSLRDRREQDLLRPGRHQGRRRRRRRAHCRGPRRHAVCLA